MKTGVRASTFISILLLAAIPAFALQEKGSPGELLDTYLEAYSGKNTERYRSLFHPSARITCVGLDGNVNLFTLPEFIEIQTRYFHRNRTVLESFGNIRLQVDGNAASAVADYTLTGDSQETTGTDFFAMVFEDGEWKIVSLLFTVNESVLLESESTDKDPTVKVRGDIRGRVLINN